MLFQMQQWTQPKKGQLFSSDYFELNLSGISSKVLIICLDQLRILQIASFGIFYF